MCRPFFTVSFLFFKLGRGGRRTGGGYNFKSQHGGIGKRGVGDEVRAVVLGGENEGAVFDGKAGEFVQGCDVLISLHPQL